MKWFELLKQEYNCPVVMLHVPYQTGRRTSRRTMRAYVVDQLEREVIPALEKVAGKKLDRDELARRLAALGAGRGAISSPCGSRREHRPSPIDGYFGGVYYVGPIFSSFRGTEDAVALLPRAARRGRGSACAQARADDARRRCRAGEVPPRRRGPAELDAASSTSGACSAARARPWSRARTRASAASTTRASATTRRARSRRSPTTASVATRTSACRRGVELLERYVRDYEADGFLVNSVKSLQLLQRRAAPDAAAARGAHRRAGRLHRVRPRRPALLRQGQHREPRPELPADARGRGEGSGASRAPTAARRTRLP